MKLENTLIELTKRQSRELIKFAPELNSGDAIISLMINGQAFPEHGVLKIIKIPEAGMIE